MLEQTSPEQAQAIQRFAMQEKAAIPQHSAAIDAAVVMLLQDAVIPPPAGGGQTYTVLDGQAYDIDATSIKEIGPCACPSKEALCAHRMAVRLYLQSQAALQTLMQDAASVEEESPRALQYPEMPFSINTFITVRGKRCQVTVRSTDDTDGLTRFEAILARYPEPALPDLREHPPQPAVSSAPPDTLLEEEPEPPRPVVATGVDASPRDDWCYVHKAPMRHNERGWAHNVGPGLWCSGHWCREHDMRYWENKSKRGTGTYFSHSVEDGPTCYEKKKPWQA